METAPAGLTARAPVFWTAFIGLFFDYYDLYLFIYLEKVLARAFALTPEQSGWLQFVGLAGVGLGALIFGYLADRFGRGRLMLAVFLVYAAGLAGISAAWNVPSLLGFRLLASLSLGAEWGISHTYVAERVSGVARYRWAAWLQLAILGGLLAALSSRFVEPLVGWRILFAASIVPVAILSALRWRRLAEPDPAARTTSAPTGSGRGSLLAAIRANLPAFLLCLGVASLSIASGTLNVFFARDLPQSPLYTVFFWGNLAPGLLLGAWLVRRVGVGWALAVYAIGLLALSGGSLVSGSSDRALAFALVLPLLNGIPFGLMGAWFNEMLAGYRTMLSGAAYNFGRILAGFSPVLITKLGLNTDGRYFLFSAALGGGVLALALIARGRRVNTLG